MLFRSFNVTRQTVSNWENEKNYPDLETLILMSDEFNISLDVMLKEDKHIVKKMNTEIKFSRSFKRNVSKIMACIIIVCTLGAIGWGIVWSNVKVSLEVKFKNGVESNDFQFDEQLGYYKKSIDKDTYYTLPNQSMPDYLEFALHYYATYVDYYAVVNGNNIQIRWSELGNQGEIVHEVYCLDEYGNLKYSLTEEQEKELCTENPYISTIFNDGAKIYRDVYQ